MIHVVRRLPAEYMLGAFCQHTLKAHLEGLQTDFIVVDKRRVAEHLGLLPEIFFNLLALPTHFVFETLFVDKR